MIVALALVFASQSFAQTPVADSPAPLTRLAFGSCNHHWQSQDFWKTIVAAKPEAWLWLGDIIYANSSSAENRASMYTGVKNAPGYKVLSQKSVILGTWDDHDYGPNNSGEEWKGKAQSQQILLDFLDEPKDSPRRTQEGVHAAYRFGPEGRRLKLILLDERYFRQEEGPDADILGESQWQWLERELARDSAELTIWGSSSQLLAKGPIGEESWQLYPKSRARLLDLMRKTPGSHLILSGDRHMAEYSRIELDATRRVVDFTSSGLTHHDAALRYMFKKNPLRVGKARYKKNFGMVLLDWTQYPVRVTLQILNPKNGKKIDELTL